MPKTNKDFLRINVPKMPREENSNHTKVCSCNYNHYRHQKKIKMSNLRRTILIFVRFLGTEHPKKASYFII